MYECLVTVILRGAQKNCQSVYGASVPNALVIRLPKRSQRQIFFRRVKQKKAVSWEFRSFQFRVHSYLNGKIPQEHSISNTRKTSVVVSVLQDPFT